MTRTAPVEVEPPSAATPTEATPGAQRRRGRRRGRRVLIGLGIGAVLLLLVGAWLLFGGDRAQQISEDSARQRLGSEPTTATVSVPGGRSLAAPPAAGLYRYAGTGRETTSLPPLTEDQGPQVPATVVAAVLSPSPGCWQLRVDYNTHHWQQWTYCTADGRLVETGGSTFARRAFGGLDIDNTSTFTCDPPALLVAPDDTAGTARPRTCVGSGNLIPGSTTVAGTSTVVGQEDRQVGGRSVATMHVRLDLTYAGAQTGTERTDLWFLRDNGLPVQNDHHVVVGTDTPIGQITYTEDSSIVLQSTEPA